MRWSYKTIHYELKKEGFLGSSFLDESEVEQSLNEYGQAGWELVSVTETQDGLIAIFKQPLDMEPQFVGKAGTGHFTVVDDDQAMVVDDEPAMVVDDELAVVVDDDQAMVVDDEVPMLVEDDQDEIDEFLSDDDTSNRTSDKLSSTRDDIDSIRIE